MKYLLSLLLAAMLLSCNQNSDGSTEKQDSSGVTNGVDSIAARDRVFDSVNAVLATGPGGWQLVTDDRSGLTADYIEYFVESPRKANPEYPYLARGDYNCDDRQDLAVLAVDSSDAVKLVFLYGGGGQDWWTDDMLGAALKNFPRQNFGAMKDEEELNVSLPCDAVEAEWFEKAVQVIYWDGKKFTNVWTAD